MFFLFVVFILQTIINETALRSELEAMKVTLKSEIDTKAFETELAHMKQYINYQKQACPPEAQDDPRYREIGNNCFFFENATMSHQKAQLNCKDKFRSSGVEGKLFEPKTWSFSKAVADVGQEVLPNGWAYIGVDDIESEGTFTYTSTLDDSPITIQNPQWLNGYGAKGTTMNCIALYFHTNANHAVWHDSNCASLRRSVCEAKASSHH